MTEIVSVDETRTHWGSLLARVEDGEEFVIARGSTPVAKLVPIVAPTPRRLGFVSMELPESFFDELLEDELSPWG